MKFKMHPSTANAISLFMHIFCTLLILSCTDGNNHASSSADEKGALSFSVVKNGNADISKAQAVINCDLEEIATVEAAVYDWNKNLLQKGEPWDCKAGQGTLDSVPAGGGRTIVIMLKRNDGSIISRGQKSDIKVDPGVQNNVGTIACDNFAAELKVPADQSTVNNLTMGLEWHTIAGANHYQVLVSKNKDLTDPVINENPTVENFAPTGLSDAQTYYWGVVAVDGYGHKGMASQTWSFTVDAQHQNSAPVVQINSPAPNSEFTTDDTITFAGTGNDGEEGDLNGESLIWRSSADGQIGTGETFGYERLSAGTHEITLTATDADGASSEASINIIVKGLDPEECHGNEDPNTGCITCLPGWTNANGDHCNTLLRFVDIDNHGRTDLDGMTWATARFTVQDGIDTCQTALQANAGADHCEVWVAEGTYYTYHTANHNAVQLKTGVHVYGGFSGTETNRDQRNWTENATVLDGHKHLDSEERVEHVVLCEQEGVIDGVTISGGYNSCDDVFTGGAGMYSGVNSTVVVRNTIFRDNRVDCNSGGGMFIGENGTANIINCTFTNNKADNAVGLAAHGIADIKVENCLFDRNTGWDGGAVDISGVKAVFTKTQFIADPNATSVYSAITARSHVKFEIGDDGGQIRTEINTLLELDGCLFRDNFIEYGAGGAGAVDLHNVHAKISNCGFVNNGVESSSSSNGAAISSYSTDGTMDISNSYFIGNSTRTRSHENQFIGGAIYCKDNQRVTLTNCTIVDNVVESERAETILGGGICGINTPMTITNCIIRGNSPEQVYTSASDATITYSNVTGISSNPVQNHNIDLPVYFAGGTDLHLLAHDPQDPSKRNPCIDTGDGDAAPAKDFDGNQRVDDPLTPNTGSGTPGYVDIGAFEYLP